MLTSHASLSPRRQDIQLREDLVNGALPVRLLLASSYLREDVGSPDQTFDVPEEISTVRLSNQTEQ